MKKLVIHDSKGEQKTIELTEELLKSEPQLNSILERVSKSSQMLSEYGDSYDRSHDHDKTHDRTGGDDGYSKEHSRRD